jgi:hypothetical protein
MVSSKTFISIAPIVNAKPFFENRYQVIIRIPIPVLTGHKSVGIIGIVIALPDVVLELGHVVGLCLG